MPAKEWAQRFEALFSAYVNHPLEEHLARIAELGEELVRSIVPPEEIAELFEEALLKLSRQAPHITLRESADRISIPLVELLIAYGLAFREQLSRQRVYEETKLAAKVIENAYEGIWVADGKGEIIAANSALLRTTGYTAEEMVGECLSLICGRESNGALIKKIWTNVRETGCWRGELTLRRKGEASFPAMLTLSSIRGDEGEVSNYVGVLDDLTEQKRHEEARALELGRAKQIYDMVVLPELQVIERVRINVECLPTENIGGDILQMVKLDENRFLLFLADVTGHGVPAAMTANSIKMLFKEISLTSTDPGVICSRLNKAICGNVLPDDIIAAFCGLFDLKSMTLTYCLAGLPPPVISRCGEGLHLKPTGPPIGVFESLTYGSQTAPLAAGDLFLAFTDGITEARNAKGAIFGNSGILGSIKGCDAYAVSRELMSNAAGHQQSSFFSDDVILTAIEICACNAELHPGSTAGSWSRFSSDAKCIFTARTRDIHLDSTVEKVMESISDKCSLSSDEFGKIKVALFELLSNAVEHGNLEMTALKRDPDLYDSEEYRKICFDRLNEARYGGRLVTIECIFRGNEIQISIEDEGNGFDVKAVADPTRAENLARFTGRGVRIAEMAVDRVAYDPKGSRVTLIKKISGRFQSLRDADFGDSHEDFDRQR